MASRVIGSGGAKMARPSTAGRDISTLLVHHHDLGRHAEPVEHTGRRIRGRLGRLLTHHLSRDLLPLHPSSHFAPDSRCSCSGVFIVKHISRMVSRHPWNTTSNQLSTTRRTPVRLFHASSVAGCSHPFSMVSEHSKDPTFSIPRLA